jgi:hypothetical protein
VTARARSSFVLRFDRETLARSGTVSLALAALFVAAGAWLVASRTVVNDEGLLTDVFAQWTALAPFPMLFFQKARPITSLLYVVPSIAGPEVMLYAHVLVASLAGPMIAASARALGMRLPNLAAFVVLASPVFLYGSAAGLSNVDGVVAVSFFLYLLLARRSEYAAGVVLGCLPWVRHELAVFSLIFGLYALLVARNHRLLLGALTFPVAYWLCGIVYHRDAMWLLHFPPSTAGPMPDNPISAGRHIGLQYLLGIQLLVTPAVGVAVTVDAKRLSSVERVLAVFAVTFAVLFSFLPFLRMAIEPMARHSMQTLPVIALLSARAVESWLDGAVRSRRLMIVTVALVAIWVASLDPPPAFAVPILVAYACAASCVGRAPRIAAGAAVLATSLGVLLPIGELATPVYFQPVLAWLRAHPDEIRGATIYTNSQVAAFDITTAGIGASPAKFIVGPDMVWELTELTNPANGQSDRIMRLAATRCYGDSVMWDAISPDTISAPSVFVLRHDPRLPLILPDRVWAGRLEQVVDTDSFTIARATAAPGS